MIDPVRLVHGLEAETGEPSSWLVASADLLPEGGDALDVACGQGRHALALAAAGYRVHAIDRDAAALASLRGRAERLGVYVRTEARDLESADAGTSVDLGAAAYDLVVVVHYLHRPLFPALQRALRPGGLLLYETFTVDQARRGHPRRPEFLLEPGELRRRVDPLEVLRAREGDFEGRSVASVLARRPVVESN